MNKFKQAQQKLQELGIDGWLISCNEQSDIHSPWLLGVKSHARHFIYVDAQGHHQIFAVRMEASMIEKSLKRQKISAKVNAYSKSKELIDTISKLLKDKKIALNYGENVFSARGTGYSDYLKHGEYESLTKSCEKTEFVSASQLIWDLRSVKNTSELKDLEETAKATLEILENLPNWVKIGMTEKELQAKLEYEYRKLGDIAFEAIIGSRENSADPHHNSSQRKIKVGCLLVDSGLRLNKMCSDITWTYWVGSRPPEDFIDAYKSLLIAKESANKYFVEGENHRAPAQACRDKLSELGYNHEKLFIHGLGHSMGYETHDIGTSISWRSPTSGKLKENMVYSNEPGLYWPEKWGVRLEDDIVIGKQKCKQLTYCPEEPIVI